MTNTLKCNVKITTSQVSAVVVSSYHDLQLKKGDKYFKVQR